MRVFLKVLSLFCGILCAANASAFSFNIQLTKTNNQNFPYVHVESNAEKEGNVQFTVLVNFPGLTQPSAGFTGKLELWDGERLVASSAVEDALPRSPSKIFEKDKREIPLTFNFSVSNEFLPSSKFFIVLIDGDSSRTDTLWFYLHDFAEPVGSANNKQAQMPIKP